MVRRDTDVRRTRALALKLVSVVISVAMVAAACSDGGDSADPTPPTRPRRTVAAASSLTVYATWDTRPFLVPLTQSFGRSAKTKVSLKFVPQAGLARAAVSGKADVVVGPSAALQRAAAALKFVAAPRVVAADELVIAVPAGNPKRISSLRVFGPPRNKARTILCAKKTSCRLAANQILRSVGVFPVADRELPKQASIVDLIAKRKADAALVMRTTVAPLTPRVMQLRIPSKDNYRLEYRAAMRGKNRAAVQFLTYLRGKQATGMLRSKGYQAPKGVTTIGPPSGTPPTTVKVTPPKIDPTKLKVTPKMLATIKKKLLAQARKKKKNRKRG